MSLDTCHTFFFSTPPLSVCQWLAVWFAISACIFPVSQSVSHFSLYSYPSLSSLSVFLPPPPPPILFVPLLVCLPARVSRVVTLSFFVYIFMCSSAYPPIPCLVLYIDIDISPLRPSRPIIAFFFLVCLFVCLYTVLSTFLHFSSQCFSVSLVVLIFWSPLISICVWLSQHNNAVIGTDDIVQNIVRAWILLGKGILVSFAHLSKINMICIIQLGLPI